MTSRIVTVGAAQLGPIQRADSRKDVVERLLALLQEAHDRGCDLVVPHQANKTMVTELACDAGLEADQLYFNIENVGNVSAASIPLAIHDAVADGVIDRPMRVFAPGFGAGAVGGYAVLTIDPAVVAPASDGHANGGRPAAEDPATAGSSPDDVWTAFGS